MWPFRKRKRDYLVGYLFAKGFGRCFLREQGPITEEMILRIEAELSGPDRGGNVSIVSVVPLAKNSKGSA